LSFLGIGTPAEHVSWGTLLGEARQNFSAWWLAFFPGLAIFTVIFIFNALGGKYSERGK
jgi:peptide/nickel transport system permease protein